MITCVARSTSTEWCSKVLFTLSSCSAVFDRKDTNSWQASILVWGQPKLIRVKLQCSQFVDTFQCAMIVTPRPCDIRTIPIKTRCVFTLVLGRWIANTWRMAIAMQEAATILVSVDYRYWSSPYHEMDRQNGLSYLNMLKRLHYLGSWSIQAVICERTLATWPAPARRAGKQAQRAV